MKKLRFVSCTVVTILLSVLFGSLARAQEPPADPTEEFGPVVRAYLGYLESEQEVVDDRASRREISAKYYRRNSNRIRALRQIALSIARESNNDYLPELEAAARDELRTLFEKPPKPKSFRVGQVLNNMYRYLGAVRAGELFFVFARLTPDEQTELIEKNKAASTKAGTQPGQTIPVVSQDPTQPRPGQDSTGSP